MKKLMLKIVGRNITIHDNFMIPQSFNIINIAEIDKQQQSVFLKDKERFPLLFSKFNSIIFSTPFSCYFLKFVKQ